MRGFLSLAFALLVTPALASGVTVAVSDGWFRALPGNLPAGGYFKMHNSGDESAALTGASSPACSAI